MGFRTSVTVAMTVRMSVMVVVMVFMASLFAGGRCRCRDACVGLELLHTTHMQLSRVLPRGLLTCVCQELEDGLEVLGGAFW